MGVLTQGERYQVLYKARIAGLNELWNDFHSELTLPQPDPIWTQIVNRLLFNSPLIYALEQMQGRICMQERTKSTLLTRMCIYSDELICTCKHV